MDVPAALAVLEEWENASVSRDSILTTATVRNPFDYLVTEWTRLTGYWYANAVADPGSWVYLPESDGVLAYYEQSRSMGFEQWLEEVACPRASNFCLDYTHDVDVLLRYDSVQDDIQRLLGDRGHKGTICLPRTNITKGKRPYREVYTPRARELVEQHFTLELSRHGYAY